MVSFAGKLLLLHMAAPSCRGPELQTAHGRDKRVTPLEVSTDGKQLIVAPAKPSERRRKFEAAQELAHKRYGNAFRRLAD